MPGYNLVFDDVILKQLKKAGKDKKIQSILSDIFDDLEADGPVAGKRIDLRLSLYEIKLKRPPLRLYFRYKEETREIEVFEFEMKTSEKKQRSTIHRIKSKILKS